MSGQDKIAKILYVHGTFRVLSPGDHVLCAVTQTRIALDELRYWNVARQEAYISAEASVQAEERG